MAAGRTVVALGALLGRAVMSVRVVRVMLGGAAQLPDPCYSPNIQTYTNHIIKGMKWAGRAARIC